MPENASNKVLLIRLTDIGRLQAAGLPWSTYWQGHWAYRNRDRLGLKDAFRRQGRNVLVNVPRALELFSQQGAA
jgi:hypothetical protein